MLRRHEPTVDFVDATSATRNGIHGIRLSWQD
jgi:hypothetical protein